MNLIQRITVNCTPRFVVLVNYIKLKIIYFLTNFYISYSSLLNDFESLAAEKGGIEESKAKLNIHKESKTLEESKD